MESPSSAAPVARWAAQEAIYLSDPARKRCMQHGHDHCLTRDNKRKQAVVTSFGSVPLLVQARAGQGQGNHRQPNS